MAVTYRTTGAGYDTVITTSAAQTVNRWKAELIRDIYDKGFWNKFMGKGPEFAIQVDEDFVRTAGDVKKFDLAVALDGSGKAEGSQLLDNEDQMTFQQDQVKIASIRNAVRSATAMSLQRPAFYKSPDKDGVAKFRMDAKNRLGDWGAELILDTYIADMLCGDTTRTFGQQAHAPTTYRVLYSGSGSATTDLTSADKFELRMLDKARVKCITRATTGVPRIRPAKINGLDGRHYIAVLHPYQVRDMQESTLTGQWMDIQKAAGLRGDVNRIFKGVQANFVGYYNGFLIFEHDSLYTATTWGGGSVEGATGLVLGAGAMYFCWCQYPNWVEEWIDYKERLGIASRMIFGMDKVQFNSIDFATIALQTAAAS
jgi:N4-gp56 family major capsid protein